MFGRRLLALLLLLCCSLTNAQFQTCDKDYFHNLESCFTFQIWWDGVLYLYQWFAIFEGEASDYSSAKDCDVCAGYLADAQPYIDAGTLKIDQRPPEIPIADPNTDPYQILETRGYNDETLPFVLVEAAEGKYLDYDSAALHCCAIWDEQSRCRTLMAQQYQGFPDMTELEQANAIDKLTSDFSGYEQITAFISLRWRSKEPIWLWSGPYIGHEQLDDTKANWASGEPTGTYLQPDVFCAFTESRRDNQWVSKHCFPYPVSGVLGPNGPESYGDAHLPRHVVCKNPYYKRTMDFLGKGECTDAQKSGVFERCNSIDPTTGKARHFASPTDCQNAAHGFGLGKAVGFHYREYKTGPNAGINQCQVLFQDGELSSCPSGWKKFNQAKHNAVHLQQSMEGESSTSEFSCYSIRY